MPIHRQEAEDFDTLEEQFWLDNYDARSYPGGASHEAFGPAYALGMTSCRTNVDYHHSFGDFEDKMSQDREQVKGALKLSWKQARHVVRDAWGRLTK